jgi:hypothetical protein
MKWWLVAAGLWVMGCGLWVAARGDGPEPRRPHFTDIASKSNFAYRTDNNFTGRKYFPQTMCGGVAAFDFDNDGRMDLFFTNGAKLPELEKTDPRFYNCLLRNRGDGTFEDVTARAGLLGKDLGYSFGVAAGDYDNDGFEDLFICNAGPERALPQQRRRHFHGRHCALRHYQAEGCVERGRRVV